MSDRRLVVHIGEVIVDADHGADLAALEAEVRAGITQAFAGGRPPAFRGDAPALEATHTGVRGIGAAIAGATPPPRRQP